MSGWNITVPTTQYVGPSPQIIKDNPDSLYRDPIGSLTAQESEHFNAFITELQAHKTVAVDTETTGLCVWKDRPLYASFAWGNRRATIHASLLPWLRPVFADNSKNWIMANAKYDTHILSNVSVYNPAADVHPYGKLVDTCVAHSLLYEDMPHGLKYMCQHLGGWSWGDFQDQFGKITAAQSSTQLIRKAEIENFSLLVEYAGNDAWGTLLVFNRLKEQLERAGTHSLFRTKPPYIETLWDLFWKVEVPYTRCLWKMERHGIRVNRDVLEKARPEAEQYIQKLQHQINKLAGRVLNPRSTPQLQKWLIEERKLPPLRKTKGGKTGKRAPSTDSGFLQHYADAGDEACALVLEHREYTKLLGTYINGLHNLLDPNDRIHSRFNQDVARCMPAGELVLTNRGYLPVEQVKVGDSVLTHRGRARPVIEVSQHSPQPIHVVELSNGLTLRTTGNHQYWTPTGWVRADALAKDDKIIVHSGPEEWRKVENWEYSVSSWGRVRSDSTGTVLSQQPKGKWGHLKVTLLRNGAQVRGEDKKDFTVHRLVAAAFAAPAAGTEVRHLDGIAWNNTKENLLWGTSKENTADSRVHRTSRGAPKLTLEQGQQQLHRALVVRRYVARAAPTFGLTVEEDHSHITGGIVTHNTGRLSCVREDTPLRTARGVKPIKNVVVGDLVWTHRGRWRRVLKTFTKGPGDMYTVQFSNGQELVCTPAHELLLASGAWKTLHEIRVQKTSNAPYPELASVHAGTPVGIQKISYCGNFEVYDLTVEEDHSYLACGVFSHNSADPNLQNIPKPDNDHWNLRGAFIAKPGHKILCFDYKQLEMRLLAAASLEQGMLDLIHAGKDIHIGNAELVFGLPYEDIVAAKACAPDQLTAYYKECLAARDAVKTIGFGIIYGMGTQKLATTLGISPEDAEKKIQQFLRRYDAIEAFTKEAVEETRATGYAFTVLGRRRNIPQIASNRRKERSQGERLATNTPIQGCLPAKTRILTKEGYLPIGDAPERGLTWTGTSWERYVKLDRGPAQLAQLTLSNGQVLDCDVRHSVLVNDGHNYVFKHYDELLAGDAVCLTLARPLEFGHARAHTDHYYWMGFYTGNAWSSGGRDHKNALSVAFGDRKGRYKKEDHTAAFTAYIQNAFALDTQKPYVSEGKITVTVENAGVRRFYESLGYHWGKTAHHKRVPTTLWSAPLAHRQMFLLGMLDADGHLKDVPNIHLCQKEVLAELQILFRTCGVESNLRGPYGENQSYRLDLVGSQCAKYLGYGTLKGRTCLPNDPAPRRVAEEAATLNIGSTKSHTVLRSRIRRGGDIGVYTLADMHDASGVPHQLYATRKLVSKTTLDAWEPTYTLSVDSQLHRYDSEGVISKNSAADVVKMAQINYEACGYERETGCSIVLQVHDELVFECPEEHVDYMMQEIPELMRHPFYEDLAVMLDVDGGVGDSWGEAK